MKIFIVGAGGHSRVVYEILSYDKNVEVVAFIDNVIHNSKENIMGVPVLGDHSVILQLVNDGVVGAFVGVGDNDIRASHFCKLQNMKLELLKAIHRTAHVAHNAKIGKGTMVGIGAIIATGAVVGNDAIINTGAIIEHDDIINDHAHIAPGAVLAGSVVVGERSFVGAGSVVKERVNIGKNVSIGAGSVVLDDIEDNAVAVGAPAKIIKFKKEGNKDSLLSNVNNMDNWIS